MQGVWSMSKALGGMSKDMNLALARKTCSYCGKDFVPGESKILEDGRFYHSKCFHKIVVEAV